MLRKKKSNQAMQPTAGPAHASLYLGLKRNRARRNECLLNYPSDQIANSPPPGSLK